MDVSFETSASTAKLDAALVQVQGAVDVAEKDKENPHYRSRYADLASIWRACRPALVKHGVNVTQWPSRGEDNRLHLVTRVAHDGEWMLCHFAMPVSKQDPQGYGSAITYAKRYCLAAVLGVVSDEDDDGNAASGNGRDASGRPNRSAPPKSTTETCPKCKASEIYDNRAKKAAGEFSDKSPDYACKDKDGCGWALWLDSARAALKSAVENMEVAGTVPAGSTKRIMEGVEDGDLSSLRIAQDWVNSKQAGGDA